jgi:chemotaxis protein CheC
MLKKGETACHAFALTRQTMNLQTRRGKLIVSPKGHFLAKILIVDDSATARSIVAKLLVGEHEVTEAASGRAALDMLGVGGFDLVLLDLLMPGISGFDVLGELAARSSAVPVIVATADIQNSTRVRAEALGAVGLVNKPFNKAALDAAIAAIPRPAPGDGSVPLEPLLKDAFQELMGIAIGKAAGVLNSMLSSHIDLSVPLVELVTEAELSARFSRLGQGKLAAIEMRCTGGLETSIELIFTSEDAGKLADCVMGLGQGDPVDLGSMRAGVLCEIGNIVINAVFGTISNLLVIHLSFTVPSYIEARADALAGELSLPGDGVILLVKTRFEVEEMSINGDIVLFLSMNSFDSLSQILRDNRGSRG